MAPHHPTRHRRPAYTLIELLVVVTILITLVAISLPLVKHVLEDNYVREASRQLNGYLAMTKINAVRTGRPWGLMMQCETPVGSTAPNVLMVTKVYLAEVQPPYTGSTVGARGEIYKPNGATNPAEFVPVDATGMVDANELQYLTGASALIANGEVFYVRFDYKGEWYRCQRNGTQLLCLGTQNGLGYPLPLGYNNTSPTAACAKPFQILRGPRKVGNPLELTSGSCIDLVYSGIGPGGAGQSITGGSTSLVPAWGGFPVDAIAATAASMNPIPQPSGISALTIMFSPGGGVDAIYVNNGLLCTPLSTINLLVGKVQKVDDPVGPSTTHTSGINLFDPAHSNLADATTLWVTIGRTTGDVTTSENVPSAGWNDFSAVGRLGFLMDARQIAIGREQMGGR